MADTYLGERMNRGHRTYDNLVELKAAGSAITSTTATTAINFEIRKYLNLCAIINVTAIDAASGNETYVIAIEVSDTQGGTFTVISQTPNIRAAGVGKYIIPLSGELAQKLDDDSDWVRINATLGGTSPSLTYTAYLATL